MPTVAITDIGSLVTNDETLESGLLGEIKDAAIVIEDGLIAWVGSKHSVPAVDRSMSAGGRTVLPGFVDSHAHLMFAGDRAGEPRAWPCQRPRWIGAFPALRRAAS